MRAIDQLLSWVAGEVAGGTKACRDTTGCRRIQRQQRAFRPVGGVTADDLRCAAPHLHLHVAMVRGCCGGDDDRLGGRSLG